MAGLLDYLSANPGLLQQFFPEQNARRLSADTPLFDITAGQGEGGWNINLGKPGSLTTPALTQSQFDGRFGGAQPATQPQQAPAPQMQPPAQAQQAFAMPSSSYAMGGTNVPVFGQAENPAIPPNATPTEGRSNVAIPAMAAAPSAPAVNSNPMMEFLSAIRPGFVGRYESRKTQQQNAQNLSTFFQGKGMDPNQANAMAAVAAQNPKIMEEFFKQPATIEGALARDMAFGTGGGTAKGGDGMTRYMDYLRNKKGAETQGEKQGAAQAEAQIALPGAAADFQQSMQTISELRGHKGRDSLGWHGPSANLPAEWMRGSEAYGAAKLEERLKSRVFGDQVKTMVGMGALSNAEGSKITDAVASLDRGLKKDEYNRTLDFIQETMKNGMDKIATKAGQPAPFGWKGNNGWKEVPMPGSSAPVRIRQVQ